MVETYETGDQIHWNNDGIREYGTITSMQLFKSLQGPNERQMNVFNGRTQKPDTVDAAHVIE